MLFAWLFMFQFCFTQVTLYDMLLLNLALHEVVRTLDRHRSSLAFIMECLTAAVMACCLILSQCCEYDHSTTARLWTTFFLTPFIHILVVRSSCCALVGQFRILT